MPLTDDLERIALLAAEHAAPGERVAGVIAAEPADGSRVYLCAYDDEHGRRAWLALRGDGTPVEERASVRQAALIAALCEIAAESAGGGDLDGLRSDLVAVRLRENPPGIADAEEAALELERVVGAAPRLASPGYLDAVGTATLRLERALGHGAGSPFAEAMKQAVDAVDSLADDVEAHYKRRLA